MLQQKYFLRKFHRGAYENLWSEHKYAVLSVSYKAFLAGSGRFSAKPPQILGFLAFLARMYKAEHTEKRNALLHIYDHVRKYLSRDRKKALIEGIISDNENIIDELYKTGVEFQESAVFASRVFFSKKGFNKFWSAELPFGLKVGLGPFLAHISPVEIGYRMCRVCQISKKELIEIVSSLRKGMPKQDFNKIPKAIQDFLTNYSMVAVLSNYVFLHSRVCLQLESNESFVPPGAEFPLRVLERFWDFDLERVPILPTFEEWRETYFLEADSLCYKPEGAEIEESFVCIRNAFLEQAHAEGFKVEYLGVE